MRRIQPLNPANHWSTNSTALPEAVAPSLPGDPPLLPSGIAVPGLAEDPSKTARSLLDAMEASFQSSQRALLSRDLAAIEQQTREQVRLRREFEALSRCGLVGSDSDLRAAEEYVLHLGRVQLALVARAQRSLRILSNLLAGPQSTYGPPVSCHGATDFANPDPTPREEGDGCPV